MTLHHTKNSREYKKLFKFFGYKISKIKNINQIPYIPVNLFKNKDLRSIKSKDISKILLSSGTSNNSLSKIYLDKANAHNQIKVLKKIVESLLGNQRLPMLIIAQNPANGRREKFNARSAAIYGFSIFGSNHTYLLNEEGKIDYLLLNNFRNFSPLISINFNKIDPTIKFC